VGKSGWGGAAVEDEGFLAGAAVSRRLPVFALSCDLSRFVDSGTAMLLVQALLTGALEVQSRHLPASREPAILFAVPSNEQDSAQPEDWADRLCPECGLCCNGVLFADVRLLRSDSRLALKEAGLTLVRSRGRPAFTQPCACFDGRLCTIYPQRPGRCRAFECYTLRQLQRGELSPAQALRRIRAAVKLADGIRQMLRDLAQTDESLALTHRYGRAMAAPIDLSDGGKDAELRGELMLTVGRLMATAHREFLKKG
jgi:Fe-S-cluster containining protein